MSLTDNEIMGGVGFGDDEYSFYNYAEDISDLLDDGKTPLSSAPGRRVNDPFDKMMSGEEISYVKHNPRITNSQHYYLNRAEMRGKPEPYGREFAQGSIPEDLDNGDTVQRYLINRMSAPHVPMPSKFRPPEPTPGVERFSGGKLEKLEAGVRGVLGENTVSMLLTIIFILIVAIIVLQIFNARKIQKLVKTILKSIPRPIFVSTVEKTNE